MKKPYDIEKTVNQTLNSIDNLQQAEANDYLFDKIKQRMQHTDNAMPIHYNKIMLRLAAVLILFIGINCVSFYVLNKGTNITIAAKTNPADAFANAYGLNTNTDSY